MVWHNVNDGIFTTELQLDSSEREKITSSIDMDASTPRKNGVRVSEVNFDTTNAYTYSPDLFSDDLYNDMKNSVLDLIKMKIGDKILPDQWWVMKYTDGDKTNPHHHRPWDWVAVYYIEAEEGCGALYFIDEDVRIYPYTGLLVLHKSYLGHAVDANTKENVKRYCMVLNMKESRK